MIVDVLVDQIATEVRHLTNNATPDSDGFRQQAAVSVMARVPVILSSAIYSSDLAGGTASEGLETTLALGAGICGDHVGLGAVIFDLLAIPYRDVQVFYHDDGTARNHTFLEILWGGEWRMVDITWGFIPHRGNLDSALSYRQAADENHRDGLHHTLIPWRIGVESKYDIFGYLTSGADAVYYDGLGALKTTLAEGKAVFDHPRTNWLGRWPHRGDMSGDHAMSLTIPKGSWTVSIEGTANQSGRFYVDEDFVELTTGENKLGFDARGPVSLRLGFRPGSTTGYLAISELAGKRLRKTVTRSLADRGTSPRSLRLLG